MKRERPGLHALVLAAGAGRRFGGGKLLAPWNGRPLIEAALRSALAAPVASVRAIVGADADRVAAAVNAFVRSHGHVIDVVTCPDWAEGLSASLRAGIAALPPDAEGAFVFLGDMPLIPAAILPELAAALRAGAAAAAPVYGDQRGNPVVLGRELLARAGELCGDRGAGRLLDAAGDKVVLVQTANDGVLRDIDLPADLVQPAD